MLQPNDNSLRDLDNTDITGGPNPPGDPNPVRITDVPIPFDPDLAMKEQNENNPIINRRTYLP